MNVDKKVGFNKGKVRCFNCHDPCHFARECPKPDRRLNNDRTMVVVGNNHGGATVNSETAMVAQSFDWEDQIQALNISAPENAHLAQVNDEAPVKNVAADPEEKMMELQFALMVSSTSELKKSEVSLPSCSQACIDFVKILREEIKSLRREVEDLRYEGYQLRKGQKPLKPRLE